MKLLVIDGTNILRRVYEANPAPDSPEKADGAIVAAIGSFKRALLEHNPTHVVPTFDHGGSTWRHDIYPVYKIKRKPVPAQLKEKFGVFYEKLGELGLHPVSVPGVEADDVVAAICLRWLAMGRGDVVALSNDKDICQLVENGVRVFDHFKSEWRDAEWIEKKWGIVPSMVADHLALVGDEDEIPGASGCGVKTAAKLLNQFGSLSNLLDSAETVPGKMGQTLINEKDQIVLSRKLVSFKTDMKIGITWNEMIYNAPLVEKEEDRANPVTTAKSIAKNRRLTPN